MGNEFPFDVHARGLLLRALRKLPRLFVSHPGFLMSKESKLILGGRVGVIVGRSLCSVLCDCSRGEKSVFILVSVVVVVGFVIRCLWISKSFIGKQNSYITRWLFNGECRFNRKLYFWAVVVGHFFLSNMLFQVVSICFDYSVISEIVRELFKPYRLFLSEFMISLCFVRRNFGAASQCSIYWTLLHAVPSHL